jgi:hypothetical protein
MLSNPINSMKMKFNVILFIAFALSGCSKNSTSKNSQSMTPCSVSNQGIYISSEPRPNGATSKINTFKIDSVVLKANQWTLWFTEDGSNEKLIATLKRYDNEIFQSGTYYFLDSANTNFQPPYTSMTYPVVFFEVKSLNNSQNAFYLYDQFEVCVSNENGKFGILIDGTKVADTRTGNSSVFLTFSLENNPILSR